MHAYMILTNYLDMITCHTTCYASSIQRILDLVYKLGAYMALNHFECLGLLGNMVRLGFVSGAHDSKCGSSGRISNKNNSTNYQIETVEPSYFCSSIYYGGQENYSPRSRTTEPHHVVSAIILTPFSTALVWLDGFIYLKIDTFITSANVIFRCTIVLKTTF